MDKPTFYGVIPANVRYAKIADRAKLIFSEITAMSNKWGYCNASNSYFAQVWECDPSVISRHISTLEKIGAVRCEYFREGKQVKERKIYPLAMGGVLHPMQGGIAPDAQQVLHPMQGGIACDIKENTTRDNNTSINSKGIPLAVSGSPLPAELEQEQETLHSEPEKPQPPISAAPPSPPPAKPKKEPFAPPTLEEVHAAFVEVLTKKGSPHAKEWAENEASNFLAYWENAKFKPGKSGKWVLGLRVNTWVGNLNGKIMRPVFGAQQINQPAAPRPVIPIIPQAKPVFSQQDIEINDAARAELMDMFKQMGVR